MITPAIAGGHGAPTWLAGPGAPARRLTAIAVVLGALAVGCKRSPPPPPPEPEPPAATPLTPAERDARDAGAPSDGPAYRRADSGYHADPAVAGTGKTYMVVSEGRDATRAGRDLLAAGGNAVDAAVATAFALAVVHPTAGNLGGGGFAVVRTGPGKIVALDFRETAPAAATRDMYLDAAGKPTRDSLFGYRASGVPGAVAGLWALHHRYGKLPWKQVVAPSIALARDGFELEPSQGSSAAAHAADLAKFPATAAIWAPGGKPRKTGDHVVLPDLAATLERIADRGPDDFYKGKTAQLIVAEMQRGHGLITAKDLAGYKVVWREPVRATYRGRKLASMPPPSSGGVVLALTANILGRIDVGALGWHSPDHVRWLVETWRRGYAARNEALGDPAFVDNPVAKLSSPAYAAALAKTIGPRASPSLPVAPLLESNNTTNLVTVDRDDMAVALTTTINGAWGSYVTITGAGFLMNNEMDDFTAKPGSPNVYGLVQGSANEIAPGKRMLSSMSPTIIEDEDGKLAIVVGVGRGGPRIITALWQSVSNVIDFGLPVAQAVGAPRLHFQHLPDVVKVEADAITEPAAKDLAARGYTLSWVPTPYFAAATMIVRTPDGWAGTADPRNGGAAMGD